VVLLVAAVLLERVLRPSPAVPKPAVMMCGVLPALGLMAAAAVDVVMQGWWQ
jgi:hypothetical protein